MQERTVLLLVVVLVVSTAAAGVAVNLLSTNGSVAQRPFDLSLGSNGTAAVGSSVQLRAILRQNTPDATSQGIVFLSLDVGTMNITSSTPGTNPWGYPTVWNLTGLDLTTPRAFNVTAILTETGTNWVYAMIWVPLGDLRSVPIDARGHVNPSGVTLESVASLALTVTA